MASQVKVSEGAPLLGFSAKEAPPTLDSSEQRSKKRVLSLALCATFLALVIPPTISTLGKPVYSEGCFGNDNETVASVEGLPSPHPSSPSPPPSAPSLPPPPRALREAAGNETANVSGGGSDDARCILRGREKETLVCAALILFGLKLCSLERASALFTQVLGSTDAAQRAFPFSLVFRAVAFWGFWGVLFALVMNVWKHADRFSDGTLVALRSPSGKFNLVVEGA